MFPWTSDDGFAVVDHRAVNPALGTWADVAELAAEHAVMFDFVANHTSSHSPWFLGWLAGDPAYAGFYVEQDPDFDESRVRPAPDHAALPRVPPAGRHRRRGRGPPSARTRSTSTCAARRPCSS